VHWGGFEVETFLQRVQKCTLLRAGHQDAKEAV
jgi:hypothetical protein